MKDAKLCSLCFAKEIEGEEKVYCVQAKSSTKKPWYHKKCFEKHGEAYTQRKWI